MLGARTTLPPGPFYSTPFVAGRELRRDPLGMTVRVWREYGDTTCIRMGPLRFYMAFHPDDVKHVMQENNQNYVKGALIARARVLIGNGLFSSEGPFWRRQRRLMQPAFHRQRIAGFVDTMVACTARALDRWEPHAEAGTVFDVADEMNRLTLTIVGQTLFSRDLSNEAGPAGAALARVLVLTAERVMSYLVWPLWVPTRGNRELLRNRRVLDEVVLDVIERRRRGETNGEDLLAMLIEARDEETGAGMTNRQLRDEAITFFLAGHETTAVATSWAWYLLDRHPEIAERLRAEVEQAIGDRLPTLDDMPGLGYARMVIQEAMRLYPPLWGLARETLGPDRVGGYDVPAGRIVSLSPYVTHRHPDFWDDPERFDPERFTPARIAARHKFAYLPFGGGPRLCIGNEFALTEAQIILAMTVQRYRLRHAGDGPIALDPSLTLRPRGGVPVRAERVGRAATGPRRLTGRVAAGVPSRGEEWAAIAVPRIAVSMLLAHLVFALVPLLSPGLFPKTQPHDLATWPGRADRVFVWLVWPPFFVTGVLTWAIVTPGLVASWWHLRRLSVARVAVWGALMGAWAALLFFASPVVTTARLLGNVGVGDGLLELAVRGALHLVVVPVVFALIAGLGARDRTR